MKYQDWCIDMLEKGLELGVKDNGIYSYAMANGLIGQYAETYTLNGKEMKFWNLDYHARNNRGKRLWGVLLVSENCHALLERIEGGDRPLGKYPAAERPYYEHCEPKSFTYANLRKSPFIYSIRKVMSYCKLFAITKEESKLLDGRTCGRFNDEDEALIESWEPIIGSHHAEQAVKSMRKSKDEWYSSKTHGTAFARAAHLINGGVRFTWPLDPDADSEKSQAELIRDYLENSERVWKTI